MWPSKSKRGLGVDCCQPRSRPHCHGVIEPVRGVKRGRSRPSNHFLAFLPPPLTHDQSINPLCSSTCRRKKLGPHRSNHNRPKRRRPSKQSSLVDSLTALPPSHQRLSFARLPSPIARRQPPVAWRIILASHGTGSSRCVLHSASAVHSGLATGFNSAGSSALASRPQTQELETCPICSLHSV